MTPEQLQTAAIKIYGRKKWKPKLAADLGINTSTIFRIMHREQVPGPVEVATKALLENRRRQVVLEREARKLLPRRVRRKKTK
jgi:phosphotransacetylase